VIAAESSVELEAIVDRLMALEGALDGRGVARRGAAVRELRDLSMRAAHPQVATWLNELASRLETPVEAA
jgi:hypothetical protein